MSKNNAKNYYGIGSREDAVVLWVLVALDSLVRDGVITGPKKLVTPKGRRTMAKLIKSGFSPTDEEVAAVMDDMKKEGFL